MKISIPTTSSQETFKGAIQFFIDNHALGIGTFGPADIKNSNPTYGYIMNTPKLAWQKSVISSCSKRVKGTNRIYN
jgi:fructokinase